MSEYMLLGECTSEVILDSLFLLLVGTRRFCLGATLGRVADGGSGMWCTMGVGCKHSCMQA